MPNAILTLCAQCRTYTREVEGPSKLWLIERLDADLQKLHTEAKQSQQQLQRQTQNGATEDKPDMTALLQLRRLISAYQVRLAVRKAEKSSQITERNTELLWTSPDLVPPNEIISCAWPNSIL